MAKPNSDNQQPKKGESKPKAPTPKRRPLSVSELKARKLNTDKTWSRSER